MPIVSNFPSGESIYRKVVAAGYEGSEAEFSSLLANAASKSDVEDIKPKATLVTLSNSESIRLRSEPDEYGSFVGIGGTSVGIACNTSISTSVIIQNDGYSFFRVGNQSWQQKYMLDTTHYGFRLLTCYKNKFIAFCSNIAYYSSFGRTWTDVALPVGRVWKNAACSDDRIVVASQTTTTDNIILYSDDGVTWQTATITPKVAQGSYYVAFGGGKFVVVGYGGWSAYSTDGVTWTDSTSQCLSVPTAITYGNGLFVVTGYSGDVFAYSSDGMTWETAHMPASGTWRSVLYADGKFVAALDGQNNASAGVAYSLDGHTWKMVNIPDEFSNSQWANIAYCNNGFVLLQNKSYAELIYLIDTIEYTVPVADVVADESKQYITAIPSSNSARQYYKNGLALASQADDSVTFTALTLPDEDVKAWVIIQQIDDTTT